MDKQVLFSIDNSTKVLDTATSNSTVPLLTTMRPAGGQAVSLTLVAVLGIVILTIGICTNTVVLAVLIRARKQLGKGVHVLITNQCTMDLCTQVFGMPVMIMMLTHGFKYNDNPIVDGTICMLFEAVMLASTSIIAEKFGLMVITLERYFKIVHAIAHRKYYRDWMTKVGVALPWIGGICFTLIPNMFTTRVVNGRCIKLGVWPNKAMATVSCTCLSFA